MKTNSNLIVHTTSHRYILHGNKSFFSSDSDTYDRDAKRDGERDGEIMGWMGGRSMCLKGRGHVTHSQGCSCNIYQRASPVLHSCKRTTTLIGHMQIL